MSTVALQRPIPSPSPSPPNLGRKTSLIDLKDWIVDDGPQVSRCNVDPLITFDSPPKPKPKPKPANLVGKPKPPQLPPRTPSFSSPPQTAFLYPPRPLDDQTRKQPSLYLNIDPRSRNASAHAPSSSISSFHSVSLSSDTDPSTPGSISNFIATFPMDTETDSISLTESYEHVSASSIASPSTEQLMNQKWEKAMAKRPPKLPARLNIARPSSLVKTPPPPPPPHPVSRAASITHTHSTPPSPIIKPTHSGASASSTYTPYTPRRTAPAPPPSRSSDRSSVQSFSTTHSISSNSHTDNSRKTQTPPLLSHKTKRPTPVPAAARKRYEAVFNANIIQRRKTDLDKQSTKPPLLSPNEARGRRAAGWRGLSVDLITSGDAPVPPKPDDKMNSVVGPHEKLEGPIVRLIWKRSGLDKARLTQIWNECDLTSQGALGIEAFSKGMWRIDEELRRAQSQAIRSASNASLGSYRSHSLRATTKGASPTKNGDLLH